LSHSLTTYHRIKTFNLTCLYHWLSFVKSG